MSLDLPLCTENVSKFFHTTAHDDSITIVNEDVVR